MTYYTVDALMVLADTLGVPWVADRIYLTYHFPTLAAYL
jgi:hypothetical protein